MEQGGTHPHRLQTLISWAARFHGECQKILIQGITPTRHHKAITLIQTLQVAFPLLRGLTPHQGLGYPIWASLGPHHHIIMAISNLIFVSVIFENAVFYVPKTVFVSLDHADC